MLLPDDGAGRQDRLAVCYKKYRIIAEAVVIIQGNKSREKEGRIHEKQHQDIKNRAGKNTLWEGNS